MTLIPQALFRPVCNPNMLLWSIALFQFHYTLYQAFHHFLTYALDRNVCILSRLHQDEYLIDCL